MLPMFYDIISESHDMEGHPELAIETYKKGLLVAPDATILYHNLAITYLESLKNPDEARRTLQKGADVDPTEPALQLMLGQIYHQSGYETPAFLAFSTYLIFEPTGQRSLQGIGLWRQILRGGLAASSGAPGGGGPAAAMRDGASPRAAAKTDEGDFTAIDAQFAIGQQKIIAAMDNGAGEMPTLIAQLDDLLTRLAARPAAADQGTFVGRHYLPYFAELKRRNLVEPFVYWVLQRAPVTGVRDWLTTNRPRVQEFLDCTKGFAWAKG
jgi:tetratricopeptide (TPR) repeat protein